MPNGNITASESHSGLLSEANSDLKALAKRVEAIEKALTVPGSGSITDSFARLVNLFERIEKRVIREIDKAAAREEGRPKR